MRFWFGKSYNSYKMSKMTERYIQELLWYANKLVGKSKLSLFLSLNSKRKMPERQIELLFKFWFSYKLNIKTTQIYTKVINPKMNNIKSPLLKWYYNILSRIPSFLYLTLKQCKNTKHLLFL